MAADNAQLALVSVVGEDIIADSRQVAERYGRDHKNVIATIEKIGLDVSQSHRPLFHIGYYKDSYGRDQKLYHITLDGMVTLTGRMKGEEPMAPPPP